MRLSLEEIPGEVRKRAKLLLLDAVGAAFASTRFDFARKALAALGAMGDGKSTVIGMSAALGLRDAALLNGILTHGLDYDDTYLPGSVHLTASCMPAVLAMAEQRASSGREALVACVVGLETGARLGLAGRGGFLRSGFQATGLLGTFSAALIAGRLLGLGLAQLEMAQGLALSLASGNMQPVLEGVWAKRLHPGWAASSGITAAFLASEGYTGPAQTYEGRFGLFPSFVRERPAASDLLAVTRELGVRWSFPEASIKLFPACHQSHAAMNAALWLHRVETFGVDDIATIHALVPEVAVPLICEPAAAKRRPGSSYAAQFSLPYALACCLARGRFGLAELEDGSYTDAGLLELADKVTYAVDPNATFPKSRSGEVVLRMKNGSSISRREEIWPEQAASQDEVVEKFTRNADLVIASDRAKRIREMILNLDEVPDIRALVEQLA
ncbi:MAG: MmgE/PrpD family protein [Burkholderiales bacterium]|nr:MmgE/PrpD family protein [Burkholderiales bacterium]